MIDAKEKNRLFVIKVGIDVKNEIKEKYKCNTFEYEYNNWYSQSFIIVKHFYHIDLKNSNLCISLQRIEKN